MEGKDISEICIPILEVAYPEFDWTGYRIVQAGNLRERDFHDGKDCLGICYPQPELKLIELYISHEDFDLWHEILLHEGSHATIWNGRSPSPKQTHHSARFRDALYKAELRCGYGGKVQPMMIQSIKMR